MFIAFKKINILSLTVLHLNFINFLNCTLFRNEANTENGIH
jgi:hypothetical protein